MISRLEFLKVLGLGALASRVPWKWQEGKAQDRVLAENTEAVEELTGAIGQARDYVHGELRWTEWPCGRFVADVDGQLVEVSVDEKHWIEVPPEAQVSVQCETIDIRAAASTYAQQMAGPVTISVGVPVDMEWP